MKVCFVSFEYPPYVVGGAGVYAKALCDELAELGNEIHVISALSPESIDYVDDLVSVHRILVSRDPLLALPSFWFRLRKNFRKMEKECGGFEILHTNDVSDFPLSKGFVARALIAYNVADFQNLINNSGFLLPKGDTIGVKQAIQTLKEDSELRNSLSESAYRTSTKYTWKEAANEHLKLYQKVKNL